MAEYTVIAAAKKKEVQGQHGPMQVIALTLGQDGQADPILAEWFTKATTPLPQQGAKLDGELENSQYGWKFKRAQQGNSFAGGRRDPATEKRITRQHSQDMGIETLKLAVQLGVHEKVAGKVENVNDIVRVVKTLADAYDKDAWESSGVAS